jgi:hypothetical protein
LISTVYQHSKIVAGMKPSFAGTSGNWTNGPGMALSGREKALKMLIFS